MANLSNIINKIRNKLVEHSTRFFTDAIITDNINLILSELSADTGCYSVLAKVKMPVDTDGINLPPDLIKLIDFYVNNQKYKRIIMANVDMYMGDDYRFTPDLVYYIRNNKLITLGGLKLNDELTLMYKAYIPELVENTSELPQELNTPAFVDTVIYGVCSKLKEMDEEYDIAKYFYSIYMSKKNTLKQRIHSDEIGSLRWKSNKYDMENIKVLELGFVNDRETNIY